MFTYICIVDKKIKTLDNELRNYKEQLKKAKGPTAEHIKRRALEVLKRKVRIITLLYLYILQNMCNLSLYINRTLIYALY